MDDATLVLGARSGDREAFAAIYDRYADRIHDFCTATLRDRAEAADVAQETFLIALERLGQLREPERLRPWLYAIAHHAALKRIRGRSRVDSGDDMTDVPATAASPDEEASRAELVEFVWEAAGGLGERDRALLDLHLRQGLEGKDLADAVGVAPSHVYVMLNRLRTQVERSIGALLVARTGRRHCPALAGVLAGWDGRLTPQLRSRVARHVDGCDTCSRRRAAAVSPLELLAATPLVAAPSHLRGMVIGKARLISAGGSAVAPVTPPLSADWMLNGDGFPLADGDGPPEGARPQATDSRSVVRRWLLVAIAAAIVLLAGTTAMLIGHRSTTLLQSAAANISPPPTEPASKGATIPPLPPPSTNGIAAPTSPAQLRVGATTLDFGKAARTRQFVLSNDGGQTAAFAITAMPPLIVATPANGNIPAHGSTVVSVTIDRSQLPEGQLRAALRVLGTGTDVNVGIVGVIDRPPTISAVVSDFSSVSVADCPTADRTSATVTASVADPDGVAGVTLHTIAPDALAGTSPMKEDGAGHWSATLGPFQRTGTVTWWVTAADPGGNTSESGHHDLAVTPCASPVTTTSTTTATPLLR